MDLKETQIDSVLDRLKQFALEMSEYDCTYPDEECLSVHISELSHGMCDGCRARLALKESGIPIPKGYPQIPKSCRW